MVNVLYGYVAEDEDAMGHKDKTSIHLTFGERYKAQPNLIWPYLSIFGKYVES